MSRWQSYTLETLADDTPNSFVDGPFGSDLKTSDYVESGIPLIRIQNVKPNCFLLKETRFISGQKANQLSRHKYLPGDVVIAKLGDPCGVACVVPKAAGEGVIVADIVRFRGNPNKVDHQFLVHFINSPIARVFIDREAKGTTRQRVNLANFKKLPVPLPPIAEQKRIAAILDKAEELRGLRRKALEQLDALTQSIFLEMFGDPDTNLKKWHVLLLANLVSEFRYGSSNKSQPQGKPALRIPNVINGTIDLSDLKLIPVDDSEFERLRLNNGDILFVRTNGNPDFVGRCAIFEDKLTADTEFLGDEFIYASYLIRARLYSEVIAPVFLREFLLGKCGRKELRSRCKTSAGQFNINIPSLGAIPVPMPPLPLQQKFAQRVEAIEQLKATHRESLAQLTNQSRK